MEYIDMGGWRDDIKNGQQTAEKTTVFMKSINCAGAEAREVFRFIFNGIRAEL